MDMNGIYQKDNKFDGEESLYYVLAGNGGSSRLSKNEKYHIITCSAVAIYDINADCVVKKIKIMTWPISNQEYEAQNENSEYFNRFKDGVIYKVLGRLQYSTFGELAFLYVKEVLEENVSGTKLDKKQEKYLAPIVLEDDVLGKLVLEKSEGLFEGTYHFLGNDITIYIEVSGAVKQPGKSLWLLQEILWSILCQEMKHLENILQLMKHCMTLLWSAWKTMKMNVKFIFLHRKNLQTH